MTFSLCLSVLVFVVVCTRTLDSFSHKRNTELHHHTVCVSNKKQALVYERVCVSACACVSSVVFVCARRPVHLYVQVVHVCERFMQANVFETCDKVAKVGKCACGECAYLLCRLLSGACMSTYNAFETRDKPWSVRVRVHARVNKHYRPC